ncbi:DUF4174 domain-containing protein [Alteromonas oceanisediminis]|uniref:DUF4174 domain-containing protein n=1 Tax=Alteromonas oceanisediminis TaxID=2836180 RepID=UPI001BD94CE1|nr:DUF4174 domain-containing protein [Alteromonas oceanisediminis]
MSAHAGTLAEHRFVHRLILIKVDNSDSVKHVYAQLTAAQDDLHARKIIVYFIHNQRVTRWDPNGMGAVSVTSDIAQLITRGNVVLIGLDSEIKKAYPSLSLTRVFADIDQMPMRQAELRAAEGG